MSWTPRFHHVTQIHSDGSGWNDCGEASLSRALLEYDATTASRQSNNEWDLVRRVHNPSDPATIWDLVSRLGEIARGMADTPGQGFTSSDGLWRILNAFGLGAASTFVDQEDGSSRAYTAAYNTAMSLCWVDGTVLSPATFPASYFGGDWGYDHLILWLPNSGGVDNLFNDPLTIWPDTHTDVRYDLGAVRQAMGGVWLLPAPESVTPTTYLVKRPCALKVQPNHVCAAVESLAAGARVVPQAGRTPHWGQYKAADGKVGWLEFVNVYAA